MKYKHNNVPLNTPVYATAYSIDDENLRAYLKCEPILGEVIDLERYEKETEFLLCVDVTTDDFRSGDDFYNRSRCFSGRLECGSEC